MPLMLRCGGQLAVAAFAGLLLLGCNSLPEPQYPPNPLPQHTNQADLSSEWRDHSGFGDRWRGYDLQPALQDNWLITGDAQGRIQAFDLDDRRWPRGPRLLWQDQLDSGVSAGITLHQTQVFIPTQNGELIARDLHSGETLWEVRLPSEALSPAQILENRLVIQTADGKLTTLDASTGRTLWQYDSLVPLLTLRGTGTPTLSSTHVYAGFANGRLVALDSRTGQVRWEAAVAQPSGRTDLERLVDVDGQPLLHEGALYVTSYQGQTRALDAFTGRSRWDRDLSSYHSPLIHRQALIVVDEASRIHALDMRSGASLWQQDALFGRSLTAPVLLEDTLVVADFQGYIHLIDPTSGALLGRRGFDLDGIRATPVVDQDRLLVHSIRGRIGLFTLKKR